MTLPASSMEKVAGIYLDMDEIEPRVCAGDYRWDASGERVAVSGSETFRNFSVRNFICSDLQKARNFMPFGLEHHRDRISR